MVFLLHVGGLPLVISRIVSRNRILCEAAFSFPWTRLATIFYISEWHNLIRTRQFYCQEWQSFVRTSRFYCFGCQKLTRTMPIFCSEWQGFSQTMPPVFDWKQVVLSDFCFQSETQAVEFDVRKGILSNLHNTTSQPSRRARFGRRQSFVLLLQQNHNGLNYRRSSVLSKVISNNLPLHCKNQPFYTEVHWKVPKIMYVALRTRYCVIMLSNVAILKRHFA